MEHAAIDLGRPYSVVCYLEGDRKVIRRFRLDRAGLDRLFKDRGRCRVLVEACTESEWVARHLEDLNHEVIVGDPNFEPMYIERNRRVKTDTRDADALFEANRLGIYRPAHRRSDARQDVIELLATRDSLVRTRARWTNHMRAMLRRRGWRVPSGTPEKFFDRVGALGLAKELVSPLEPYRALWLKLNEQIEELEGKLEQIAGDDAEMELVQTAPAFGVVTSAAAVAVIDDARRFRKAHQVESYLGLVPAEWSSSEQRRRGSITKRGDTRIRWLFVEAAQRVLRSGRPECRELRRWAETIAARRGKKVATVALARRLAGIVWAMLRTGKPFDPTKLNRGLKAAA